MSPEQWAEVERNIAEQPVDRDFRLSNLLQGWNQLTVRQRSVFGIEFRAAVNDGKFPLVENTRQDGRNQQVYRRR